jgi:hypothetical protein
MMNEVEVYNKLSNEVPKGYRINELKAFSYPVRRIKLRVLANKQPDNSLINVYNVLLRCIQLGLQTQIELFTFLGLGENDEFILRELFSLREKGYLDLVSEKWIITESGEQFVVDNKILRIEEEDEFEFLIDCISGNIISSKVNQTERNKLPKFLPSNLNFKRKSPELLENKFLELSDVFKFDQENKSYLISYNPKEIISDFEEWVNYWFIEYIPVKSSIGEPRLEVRSQVSLKVNKELSQKFNTEYNHYIVNLSDSERKEFITSTLQREKLVRVTEAHIGEISTLTIWETKHKFIEALSTVQEKILIESPWIKRATQEYLPYFEEILRKNKKIVVLFGISDDAEHDYQTLRMVEQLRDKYQSNFLLIDLPSHFGKISSQMTGTHRKLVIKDDEYYIMGSFNFLSFAKQEKQQVANEESMLITVDVEKKWEQVMNEYRLSF